MIIGAGAIGKGVCVPLFLKHNMQVILANRTIEHIEDPLKKGYWIHSKSPVWIHGYIACAIMDDIFLDEIDNVDIIVIALRNQAMKDVIRKLQHCLKSRIQRPLTIVLCTNTINAVKRVKEELKDIDLLEILHMLVYIGAKHMESDPYAIALNDMHGRIEMERSIYTNMALWDDIYVINDADKRLNIKLSLINRVQLYLALMGNVKHYLYLAQCFQDKDIMRKARVSYEDCSKALLKEYPNEVDNSFTEMLWCRLLQGTVEHLSRFLLNVDQKLEDEERLMKPIHLALKHGIGIDNMMEAVTLAKVYVKK